MSEIINAIRDCHINEDVESCHKCSAWAKDNYFCQNVRNLGEGFAEKLVQEHDSVVAEVERLKELLMDTAEGLFLIIYHQRGDIVKLYEHLVKSKEGRCIK